VRKTQLPHEGGAEIHNDLADRRLFIEAGDAHADPLIGLNTHGLGGARWFGLASFSRFPSAPGCNRLRDRGFLASFCQSGRGKGFDLFCRRLRGRQVTPGPWLCLSQGSFLLATCRKRIASERN